MTSSCCRGFSTRFGIVACGVERKACSAVSVVLLILAMAAKLGALPRVGACRAVTR